MADEQAIIELTRKVEALVRVMGGLANSIQSKDTQKGLEREHRKASKLAGLFGMYGFDPDVSKLEKNKLEGEENNQNLKELLILSQREEELRKTERIRPSEALTSPGEFLKSLTSPGAILGSLSSIGGRMKTSKGKTSLAGLAFKAPGAIRNFFKDISKTRNLKDIDKKRIEFSILSKSIDQLGKLKDDLDKKEGKTDEETKRLDELANKITEMIGSRDTKAGEFANVTIEAQMKAEGELDKGRGGLSGRDLEDYKALRKREMEESLRKQGTEKPLTKDRATASPTLRTEETSSPITRGLFGSFEGGLSGLFNHTIPISSATPANFAQAIGGIFYRLGILTEGKEGKTSEDKVGGKSGGLFGGILGTIGSMLLFKKDIKTLIKTLKLFGSAILHPIKALKGLGKLLKSPFAALKNSIGGAVKGFRGILSKLKSPFGPKKPPLPPRDAAGRFTTSARKGLGKGVTKTGAKGLGKGLAKTGAKSVLKKIPFLGAGFGALFAAQKLMAGDMTGAGLELASGATSFLPGLGSLAGLGIDAYSMKRDSDRSKMGESVEDGEEIVARDATRVNQPLRTESELERDRQSMDIKALEEAHYRALKRYNKEDIEIYGTKRAGQLAHAQYEETNK